MDPVEEYYKNKLNSMINNLSILEKENKMHIAKYSLLKANYEFNIKQIEHQIQELTFERGK